MNFVFIFSIQVITNANYDLKSDFIVSQSLWNHPTIYQ